jgi:hypothetical protein
MTNCSTTSNISPAVVTRSEAEAEATAAHRARYLAKLTPRIVWFALPLLAMLINIALIVFREPTAADFAIAFFGLCLCAYSAITFYRDDQKVRAIARLTPTYDKEALRAQATVLNSSYELLSQALKFDDPVMTKRAIEVMFGALAPLLARGPTTAENAVAAGYPRYPVIDFTPMPGNPKDMITMHLLRLEACSNKLQALVSVPPEEIVFAETVSRYAGEFIPPLRAIDAQLPTKIISA